jgi:hypothetical protein
MICNPISNCLTSFNNPPTLNGKAIMNAIEE